MDELLVTTFLRLQNPAMSLQNANDLGGVHILHFGIVFCKGNKNVTTSKKISDWGLSLSGGDGFFEDGEFQLLFLDAEFFAGVEGLEFAGAVIAVAFVPGDEFGAGGDDGDVDVGAVMADGIVGGGGEELFADAGVLLCRRNAEEAEIEAVALLFKIDAAEEGAGGTGVFEDDGSGGLEEFFDAGGIGPGAGKEMSFAGPPFLATFTAVGAVNKGDERGDVGICSGANDHNSCCPKIKKGETKTSPLIRYWRVRA